MHRIRIQEHCGFVCQEAVLMKQVSKKLRSKHHPDKLDTDEMKHQIFAGLCICRFQNVAKTEFAHDVRSAAKGFQ
jgi:hypothetical protein